MIEAGSAKVIAAGCEDYCERVDVRCAETPETPETQSQLPAALTSLGNQEVRHGIT